MSSGAPIQWESLPLPVRLVMERLESKEFQVFLVGGCLRDLLRGENPQDYDLASTVPPEEMERRIRQVQQTAWELFLKKQRRKQEDGKENV